MSTTNEETAAEKAQRKAAKAARKARERQPQRTHPWSDFQHQSCGWLNFPLFGCAVGPSPYDAQEFVVVAVGGGGSSKSGIPNGIFMTTVSQHKGSSARFGHTSEQFIDKGSVLPFAVALSSLELSLAAVTIGPMVHLYTFNASRSIGLEELTATAFKADFCTTNPADVNHVKFSSNYIITAGAERITRVWKIAVDSNPCSIELMAEFASIPKDINDLHTCMLLHNGLPQLRVAAASDDGNLRVWNIQVNAAAAAAAAPSAPTTTSTSSSVISALAPCITIPVSDDGNRHKRAGKAIFKAVRFGAGNKALTLHNSVHTTPTTTSTDSLLFGVQSRMNRGSSFLVVWRLEGVDEQSSYVELSRIKIFGGTEDKVRTMALACNLPADLNTVTVAFGSAGGLVCVAHVDERTGYSAVVGQDTRHATIVSDICAIAMEGGERNDVCVVTTSMDKGVVLHGAAGLVAKTNAVRRKRCCVTVGVLFVCALLGSLGLWYAGVVDTHRVVAWKNQIETTVGEWKRQIDTTLTEVTATTTTGENARGAVEGVEGVEGGVEEVVEEEGGVEKAETGVLVQDVAAVEESTQDEKDEKDETDEKEEREAHVAEGNGGAEEVHTEELVQDTGVAEPVETEKEASGEDVNKERAVAMNEGEDAVQIEGREEGDETAPVVEAVGEVEAVEEIAEAVKPASVEQNNAEQQAEKERRAAMNQINEL